MKWLSTARVALVCVSMMVLAGCDARYIREAQDSFNAASNEESRLAVRDDSQYVGPVPLAAYSSASANYKVALDLLEKELKENRSELDKDKLTGTAVSLKCLAMWRIADLDSPPPANPDDFGKAAAACAEDAYARRTQYALLKRDEVLMFALPGMIDADRGRRSSDYAYAKRHFSQSYAWVVRAVGLYPDHDVVVYLHLVQIRTVQAWRAAIRKTAAGQRTTLTQPEPRHASVDLLRAPPQNDPAGFDATQDGENGAYADGRLAC